MIIPINQNDVRLLFDIVCSKWLLAVLVRPDSTIFFPCIILLNHLAVATSVNPEGNSHGWYRILFQTARLCSPLLVVYGVDILVNKVSSMGNGKQEDGKWYEVMKSLSVSMIAASSSCQRLLLNCVPGVLEPGS